MYKKHAKFFSRPQRLTGLEVAYPGLLAALKRREKLDEKPKKVRRPRRGEKPCDICNYLFTTDELGDHMYTAHRHWQCGECRSYVHMDDFACHLDETHGRGVLKKWLGLRKLNKWLKRQKLVKK